MKPALWITSLAMMLPGIAITPVSATLRPVATAQLQLLLTANGPSQDGLVAATKDKDMDRGRTVTTAKCVVRIFGKALDNLIAKSWGSPVCTNAAS